MASPSSRTYLVSPAELFVFMEHFHKSPSTDKDSEIAKIAQDALKHSMPAEFTTNQWNTFKELEKKLLGAHAVEATFRKQMGIEAEDTMTLPKQWQFDLMAFKALIAPLSSQGDEKVTEVFLKLEKFQQKALLKAMAHFSETTDMMRASPRGSLSNHDMIILHSIEPIFTKLGSGSLPKGDVKRDAYNLFKILYPAYKGVMPTEDEVKQAARTDALLENWRDVNPGTSITKVDNLNWSLENKPLSLMKKWELYRDGEKRIGGDLRNDFRRLSNAFADLKVRFERGDPTVQKDILRFYETTRVAVAKGEAQVKLYRPFADDVDMVFLEAKALADLGEIRFLESSALDMMDQDGLVSPLQGNENPLQVSENARDLLADAIRLAERSHLKGHPKGGILLSKLIRLEAGMDMKKEDYYRASDALQNGLGAEDREALFEAGRLESAAWLYGIGDVREEAAIEIFRSLGKEGADGLREHFEAGSAAAGKELIQLMGKRLQPETLKERFGRFIQSIIDFFSFGSASIFGEEPFLSKDPHRFSSAEIDFLIKASLLGLEDANKLLDQAVRDRFGPKIPLQQASSFLKNVLLDQDPDMVVNGRKAYRYFQFAAETILASRRPAAEHTEFGRAMLTPYLVKIPDDSYAYEVLEPLLDELMNKLSPYKEPKPKEVVEPPPTAKAPFIGPFPPAPTDIPKKGEESAFDWWNLLLKMSIKLNETEIEPEPQDDVVPEPIVPEAPQELVAASTTAIAGTEVNPVTLEVDDEQMRILVQIAQILQNPTPDRFLGAFRMAAPMLAQVNFPRGEFAQFFRGAHHIPGGLSRYNATVIPSEVEARIESHETQSLLERFAQSASGLVLPAGWVAFVLLAAAASRAGGGQPIPQEVARNLGEIVEGARLTVPAVGQAAASVTTEALGDGQMADFFSMIPGRLAEGLAHLVRRNPAFIQGLLRNVRR